jgi:hypothetical protein
MPEQPHHEREIHQVQVHLVKDESINHAEEKHKVMDDTQDVYPEYRERPKFLSLGNSGHRRKDDGNNNNQ